MARLGAIAVLASFTCSTLSNAESPDLLPKACPCYTATRYDTSAGCPIFTPTTPCIGLPCIFIGSTITIPGPNTKCPKTPTITSNLPCQTACPVGCETYTLTKSITDTCVPLSKPTTPAYPYPSDISSLPYTIPKPTNTVTNPLPTPTPTPSRPCYTKTVTTKNSCPEDDMDCLPPDCILLTTALVPGGPVVGCPTTTPTVTASRTCKGRCDGACATQWVTATATAWKA